MYLFFSVVSTNSLSFFIPVFFCLHSESNSLSPPFFTGTNGTAQKGRPRKRKLMINHHQNDPLNLGTAMQMGMYTQLLNIIINFFFLSSPSSLSLFYCQFFPTVLFDFQSFNFFNHNFVASFITLKKKEEREKRRFFECVMMTYHS